MQPTDRIYACVGRSIAALAASALIATAALGLAGESETPPSTAKASDTAQMVGVFTGKYVQGIPVYRLPPLTISAKREPELAKTPPEDKLGHGKQARAKFTADRPVEPQHALMASDLSHK